MTTYFWGAPPGAPGDFDDAADWFNTKSQTVGNGIPGAFDIVNVVGAVPIPPAPPVHIVIPSGAERTISQLRVLFQSVDEDFVWIEGSLRVYDEIFFENDRGNLRFIGTITLDGTLDDPGTGAVEGGTSDGAAMDVDLLHIGGSQVLSARNVLAVDDDGLFAVAGNADVTTRRLEVLGTGGLEIRGGGDVEVSGPAFIQLGSPTVKVVGADSRLSILGDKGTNGEMVVSQRGSLSITNGGVVEVTGPVTIDVAPSAPASQVDQPGSALEIGGKLSLDGYLLFTGGARGKADNVTASSTDIASLVVGDLTGHNVLSAFTTNDMTLGDGHGGAGFLTALPNGQIRIKQAVTSLNPIEDGATFSGALRTIGDGWIDIGPRTPGTPDILPGSIQVNPNGFSIGLIGHGMIDTGTLRNDGLVGAQDGLLFVHADVTGQGVFLVDTQSTLEVDGNVASTATIALSGTFSTLTLDVHDKFDGKIISIDLTDRIRLRHDVGETVEWAAILPGASGEELWVLQDNRFLAYQVSGAERLVGASVIVTPSADKMSTFLAIAPHGLVTTHYLDADGKRTVTFDSGDNLGGATGILVRPDGTLTAADNGDAANRVHYDYRNQQLNSYRADWIADNGEKAYTDVTYDNSKLAPLKLGLDVQLPSAPDASQPHNLWYSFRHGPMRTLKADDGYGHFGTLDSAGHFVDASFDRGFTVSMMDAPPVAIPAPLASFASLPSGEARIAPQGLPGLGSNDWRLSQVGFDPETRVLNTFTTTEYVGGEPDIVTVWTRHENDPGWEYVETFVKVNFSRQESATALFMQNEILPRLGNLSPPGTPLVLPYHTVELSVLVTGPHGSNVVNGQILPRNTLIQPDGTVLSQEAAGVVSNDGAGVVSNDGAGFGQIDLAKLVGQNGADMKARLVGQNGADIVAGGGGNIVAGGGGNIVAGGGGNIVAGGGGNIFSQSGTGTPGRYVAGALVFADTNDDRRLNNGESWDFTDASGHYQLFGGWGTLVLVGGTDTGTNLPFTATLTAPLGSTSISSLSTLASGLAADDGDIDGAIRQLQTALGLDSKIDFTVIDPIASTENGDPSSAKIHVEMSKTMDTVFLIGAAFAGLGADSSKAQLAAFKVMVDAINDKGSLGLSDKATVSGLIGAVGTALGIEASGIAAALVEGVTSTNQLIDKLLVDKGAGTDLTGAISMVETAVQGSLSAGLKASAGDANKLGPAALLLQASTDDGKGVVTPGHVVTITLTTSEAVTVVGAPTLQLSNGKVAVFSGGSGSSSLVFKYTAQAGSGAGDLDVTGLSLGTGGSIKDNSGNALAGTVSADLGLALDTGALVTIAVLDAMKGEGSTGGTTAFTFSLARTGDTSVSHSVSWSVAGTGAFGGDAQDFAGGTLNGGTVTFAAGETSKTITVNVIADTGVEPDEDFLVSLANPSAGLVIGAGSAAGRIVNDDATVSIAAVSAVQAEGSVGPTAFTFTLAMRGDISVAHSFGYAVTGSGPIQATGSDFVDGALPTGTVTFAAGESARTVTIEVLGDTTMEADEGFTVTLSGPSTGLVFGAASAASTIQNDDGAVVSIAALSAAKTEEHGATIPFTFTVSLGQAAAVAQSVDWAVTGTGEHPANGADFAGGVLPGGTVSFAAGETSKTVTVAVSGDTVVEFDDFFAVTLSNPSVGLTLGTASAIGIIQNDDRATISIAPLSASVAEDNSGTTSFTFTVSLDQASTTSQTADWAVTGSGANPAGAADFAGGMLPGGTVTFAPGETSKTVTVNVTGDTTPEPDEGYSVTLSSPSAGLVLGVTSAAGTIQNDDIAVAVAAHNDAYVVLQGRSLTAAASLLSNDVAATTATLLSGPAHGSLQLAGNGTFTYAPASGFFGIDSFSYHASNGSSAGDGQVHLHVVPVQVGASTTLNLLALSADQQIASTYAAFFGRAADAAGFEFWVGQFVQGLPTQGAAALFSNIASSFAISEEAKALYPFLVSPFGASDSQISAFIDSVYNNLFNRSSDAGGLGYWTGQIKQTLAAGQFVGSVLINIMSGAQDTAAGKDITTLMGKVAVSLEYVHEQQAHHTKWAGASDIAAATALLDAVAAEPQSVLTGIRNAEILIAGHA